MSQSKSYSANKREGAAVAPAKQEEPIKKDGDEAADENREALIEKLSRDVASGTYQVDPTKVSSALVDKHLKK